MSTVQNIVSQYEQAAATLERARQFKLDQTNPKLVQQMVTLVAQLKTKLETEQKKVEQQMKAQLVEQECLAQLEGLDLPPLDQEAAKVGLDLKAEQARASSLWEAKNAQWNDQNDPTGYNRMTVGRWTAEAVGQLVAKFPELGRQFESGKVRGGPCATNRPYWEQQNIPEDKWKAMRFTWCRHLGYKSVGQMVTDRVLNDKELMLDIAVNLDHFDGIGMSSFSAHIRVVIGFGEGDAELFIQDILFRANDLREQMDPAKARVKLVKNDGADKKLIG